MHGCLMKMIPVSKYLVLGISPMISMMKSYLDKDKDKWWDSWTAGITLATYCFSLEKTWLDRNLIRQQIIK